MFIKKLLCMLAMLSATAAFAAVDVNKADQAALESVKGIGTKVSVRILDERKRSPFKDWPDLMARVKGIKGAAAARLSKQGLTVNGTSFDVPAPAARNNSKEEGKKKS